MFLSHECSSFHFSPNTTCVEYINCVVLNMHGNQYHLGIDVYKLQVNPEIRQQEEEVLLKKFS